MAKAAQRTRAKQLQRYLARARELGATEALLIEPRQVVCAHWVRLKCQFGCDGYGGCLTCPPYSPTPEQTRRVLDEYCHLVLVHCQGRHGVSGIARTLEREVFLEDHPKAFAWGAGPCTLCRTCDLTQPCKHAELARPSLEACGIDVFSTVRGLGLPIHVVRHRQEEDNYYALVAIE